MGDTMNLLPIQNIKEINEYWLVYRGRDGAEGYIDLSASANTFEKSRQYTSDDGLRCVGLRYIKGGNLCYELFNIGHVTLYLPVRPNPVFALIARLMGKDPVARQQEMYDEVEKKFNACGWKTIEE